MGNKMQNRKGIDRKSRRSFLKTAGLGGLGSAAMLASLNRTASAQSLEPAIIGAPLQMTGAGAADGIEFKQGLEMAAEEINALGGILGREVKIVVADTESGGDDLITSAGQRLIDRDGACALIAGYKSNRRPTHSWCKIGRRLGWAALPVRLSWLGLVACQRLDAHALKGRFATEQTPGAIVSQRIETRNFIDGLGRLAPGPPVDAAESPRRKELRDAIPLLTILPPHKG
jgi:hypothetical protein